MYLLFKIQDVLYTQIHESKKRHLEVNPHASLIDNLLRLLDVHLQIMRTYLSYKLILCSCSWACMKYMARDMKQNQIKTNQSTSIYRVKFSVALILGKSWLDSFDNHNPIPSTQTIPLKKEGCVNGDWGIIFHRMKYSYQYLIPFFYWAFEWQQSAKRKQRKHKKRVYTVSQLRKQ